MVMGGSLGARAINEAVRKALPRLLPEYNIIHLCGKGNLDEDLNHKAGYRQFEFISDELPDCFALTDMIISRAGANAIHEFMALKKPMLLIPLPLSASRGDQIENAASFAQRGLAKVLLQENMTPQTLQAQLRQLYDERADYIRAMQAEPSGNGLQAVLQILEETAKP